MKKKSILGIVIVAFMTMMALAAFKADKPSDDNRCCPPGWELKCNSKGVTNNIDKDKNEDGCLCRKDIPGKKANGNNQGPRPATNWKDNNYPCDEE